MKQLRHGDILLIAVDREPPPRAKSTESEVLAVGEATGHAHVLKSADVFLVWEEESQRYVKVGDRVDLTHPEHGTVAIPPGTYRVVPQQEWDIKKQWRRVSD